MHTMTLTRSETPVETSDPMETDSRFCPKDPGPEHDDLPLTWKGEPRCTARSKQAQRRCAREATPGQTVCASHGSKSPQAKAKAYLRLATIADEAIGVLYAEMNKKGNDSRDKQAAANSLLDRAGVSRKVEMDDGTARALLYQRLMAMREDADPQNAIEGVVEGEIVEDGE